MSFYDILLKERKLSPSVHRNGGNGGEGLLKMKEKTYFIEVKSTQYSLQKNVFSLSWQEYSFAMTTRQPSSLFPYYLFRVFNVFDYDNIQVIILKDLKRLLESGRIQLCLAI